MMLTWHPSGEMKVYANGGLGISTNQTYAKPPTTSQPHHVCMITTAKQTLNHDYIGLQVKFI